MATILKNRLENGGNIARTHLGLPPICVLVSAGALQARISEQITQQLF